MSKFLRVAASVLRPTIAQQFPMRSMVSPMNRIVIRSFADDKDDEVRRQFPHCSATRIEQLNSKLASPCFFLQPFLDAKEVADRIVEVVMNFDKVTFPLR